MPCIALCSYVAVSSIIFLSKDSSQCHQSDGRYPDKPKTYESWKPEAREKAMDTITQRVISIHRAAVDYGIPKST